MPVQAIGSVQQVPGINVGKSGKVRAAGRIDEGLEVETVAKLVQEYYHQVVQWSVVIVQKKKKIEVAAELSIDVREPGFNSVPAACRPARAIPGRGKFRTWEKTEPPNL